MGGIEVILKDKDGNIKQAFKKERKIVPGTGAVVEEFEHDPKDNGKEAKWVPK